MSSAASMGQKDSANPKSVDDLIAGMSEDSHSLLERADSLVDCRVLTSDNFGFKLHKMTLTQESVVIG